MFLSLQKKEPLGDDDNLPEDLVEGLANLAIDQLKPLSIAQIKKIRILMDRAIEDTNKKLAETEKQRNEGLRELGNHLHDSVPISDNEVHL